MRNVSLKLFALCFFLSLSFAGYSQCATPQGNETSFGNNYWIGYAYSAKDNYTTAKYSGYFNELATFNESFCGNTCSFPINGCAITTDNFTVRFKMTMALTCGDYSFTIGGDDGVRLFVDGVKVIDDYTDHGYRTSTATVLNLVEGNHNFILEYYENAGSNQVSFSYAPANGNTTGPGVIASNQSFCQAAPFDPALFTSTTAASFCTGTPSYQWQQSTDQYNWTNIGGATSATYDAPPYSTLGTTYFRRSATNGTATIYSNTLSVVTNTASGNPSVFGNGVWNAYVYNSSTYGTNYSGYYTETNLSFTSGSRWAPASGPATANTASGNAYVGCSGISTTNYVVAYKRTNFACGYFQIDIPYHDDDVTLLVNGTQVFQHIGWGDAHTNAWTGFLGASSTVEVRVMNGAGPGELRVNIAASATNPINVTTPVIVCAGSSATLTASSSISGATYSWAPDSNNAASTITPPSTNASVVITPTASGNYIVTMTDPATGCSITNSVPVTVNATANTTLSVSPTTTTVNCPGTVFTLTASGAASYTWTADTGTAGGLSSASGYQVTATPQQTTTYTVTGNTGCNTKTATVTITVNAIPTSTYPSNTWNVYGFNSQTIGTNYVGYYTENGSSTAPNNYSFDTRDRWADGTSPSTANASNGNAWTGCTMNATNISLSFKRTGFACGIYQLDVPAHDDDFLLFINGTQVAQHAGCCDSHTNVWTGVLDANSQVEWQLKQGNGGSYLKVLFTAISQPASQSTWIGNVSNDWFNSANWCGGVPTSTIDALIPAAGPKFMPVIANTGAVVRNVTINTGSAGSAYSQAYSAASLTTSGSNNLDVYGNWVNNGTLTTNTGSITFAGTSSSMITSNATETFYKLIVNKTSSATLTLSSGAQRISSDMTFTSGIVIPTATLTFLDGSTATGAKNTSYVQGAVTKTGINSFTFPVGKSGYYRPIGISSLAAATDSYTAQYFMSDPNPTYSRSSKDPSLNKVGAGEYWTMSRVSGTSARVTLSWDTPTGGVNDMTNLKVAGWNGSTWKDLGNGGTTGTNASGTIITASTTSTFNAFTLASANSNNPLPISLSAFTVVFSHAGLAQLNWTTASELNNEYFEVQRSTDGSSFVAIGDHIDGAGTSKTEHSYSFEDTAVPTGKIYYRLKQVDFDGANSYSEVRTIQNDNQEAAVSAYPNPANEAVHIDLNGRTLDGIMVMNTLGAVQNVQVSSDNSRVSVNSADLEPGVYLVNVVLGGQRTILKVLVQR